MTILRIASFCAVIFLGFLLCNNPIGALFLSALEGEKIDKTIAEDPAVKTQSNTLAHYVMGSIYDNFGETSRAISEYEKAVSFDENVSEIHARLGADLLIKGDVDNAISSLNRALEIDPENVTPYGLLAVVNTAQGNYEKAQELYEEALKHDPENLKVLTFLADLFIIQRKLDKAAEVYEKILSIRRNDAFLYFNLGLIYSKLQDLDKAKENLQKAIEQDKSFLEAQMVLGFIFEIEGDFEEAIKQYEKIAEVDPLNREAYIRLGQLYYKLGETEKAIEQNRILMRLDVNFPAPYLRAFSIYIAERRYAEAETILLEALKNGISGPFVYAGLGYLAVIEKDYPKAVEYYRIAVDKEPENNLYLFYLASALERSGERGKAIGILEKLVSETDKLPEAYNYLGYLYIEENKDLDRAVMLIQKALEKDPDNGAYVDSLGWAYFKKGMYNEALNELKRAVELMPDDPIVREHLGDTYQAIGEGEKAYEEWEKALELDPGNKSLIKKIRRNR